MEMVPFMVGMYSLMPIMTGVCAKGYGRPFWKWFFIGIALPAVSFIVLYWVSRNDDEPGEPSATVVEREERSEV